MQKGDGEQGVLWKSRGYPPLPTLGHAGRSHQLRPGPASTLSSAVPTPYLAGVRGPWKRGSQSSSFWSNTLRRKRGIILLFCPVFKSSHLPNLETEGGVNCNGLACPLGGASAVSCPGLHGPCGPPGTPLVQGHPAGCTSSWQPCRLHVGWFQPPRAHTPVRPSFSPPRLVSPSSLSRPIKVSGRLSRPTH